MMSWNNRSHPFSIEQDAILIFTPDAAVLPHFVAMCLLGKTLQELGYKVLLTRCDASFHRCPVTDMYSAPYQMSDQERIANFCAGCTQITEHLARSYGLETVSLRSHLTESDYHNVQETIQHAHGKFDTLEFDGFPFGKIGLADFSLVTKQVSYEDLSGEMLLAAQQYVETGMLSYLAVKEIAKKHNIKRICIFNVYSMQLGAAMAGRALNIPIISATQAAHHDIDRRRLVLIPRVYTSRPWVEMINDWYRWRDLPIEGACVLDIAEDGLERELGLGGQHYSPSRSRQQPDLFSLLQLDPKRKLLVAFPSSLDELVSLTHVNRAFSDPDPVTAIPFADQLEWIEELINYVEASDDLQLVVRFHPREGKNHREQRISEALGRSKAKFSGSFRNTRIIWPEEKISSYDLAEIADIALTSWSTIGPELARRGVPVLTSFRHFTIPDDDFHQWGGCTPAEYFETLRALLLRSPSLETITRAYRAYAYMTLSIAVFLDDLIPSPRHSEPVPFSMPRDAELMEKVVIEGVDLRIADREKLRAKVSLDACKIEEQAVVRSLIKLMHLYATGESHTLPREIHCVKISQSHHDPNIQASSAVFSMKDDERA
ncbi:MAG: hypothetical protein KDD60_09520, partial [Bdellovibrionales bacterium]|nr:hypothetical protein [Bdellovibrionales bacterium]